MKAGVGGSLPQVGLCFIAVLMPFVGLDSYFVYLLTVLYIYSIAAVGLNLLAGAAGQLSLAQAAFMAIGAYGQALVSKHLVAFPFFTIGGLHVWAALLAGIVAAAVFGVVLALPALRVRGPYLSMMTLAFGWLVWKVLLEWVSLTGGDLGLSSIPKARVGSWQLSDHGLYLLVLACLLLVLGVSNRVLRSTFGLQLRAISFGDLSVEASGIDGRRVKAAAFVISAAFGGFAGGLFSLHQSYVNPDAFQVFDSISLLLAVLLGGAGTVSGPVVGMAVILLLPETMHAFDQYRLIIYGVLILVTLYVLPRGLVGRFLCRGSRTWGGEPDPVGSPVEAAGLPSLLAETNPGTLALRDVSVAFDGVRAVEDVRLEVNRGSIHALIGPNGAGKTTLINAITGVVRPATGTMSVDGVPMAWSPLYAVTRRGIVRTFQSTKPLGELTVSDHVLLSLVGREGPGLGRALFSARHRRIRQTAAEESTVRELLAFVGIGHLGGTPANALSHGHRRLMELARAFAARPRVLLLDEPAAGLVAEEVQHLAKVLLRLRETRMTILVVEHNMDFVLGIADEVTALDHGVVIASGDPRSIVSDQEVVSAYLGPNHGDA